MYAVSWSEQDKQTYMRRPQVCIRRTPRCARWASPVSLGPSMSSSMQSLVLCIGLFMNPNPELS